MSASLFTAAAATVCPVSGLFSSAAATGMPLTNSTRSRDLSGPPQAWVERQPWAILLQRGTIVAMTVEPLCSVRDHLSEFVDRAEREHERIVVTRNGRPAAVLLAYDDLAALEETLDVLSDPEALADIRQADAEVGRGEVVRGVDAVRALRSHT